MSNDKNNLYFILQIGPKCFVKENTLFELTLCDKSFDAYRSQSPSDLCRTSKLILSSYGLKCVVISLKEFKGRG